MDNSDVAFKESTIGATQFSVTSCQDNRVLVQWKSKTEVELLKMNETLSVMEYIHKVYSEEYGAETVYCCTEYKRDCVTVRCHPNYQGEGPWCDWIYAEFHAATCEGSECPAGLYPCKLLAVVPQQLNDFLEETELIVLPCLMPSPEGDSVLFHEWIMAKEYEHIGVSSLDSSPFVLEIGGGKVSIAVPYCEWEEQFVDTSY